MAEPKKLVYSTKSHNKISRIYVWKISSPEAFKSRRGALVPWSSRTRNREEDKVRRRIRSSSTQMRVYRPFFLQKLDIISWSKNTNWLQCLFAKFVYEIIKEETDQNACQCLKTVISNWWISKKRDLP
jgi:hypothetical protein